MKNSNKSTITTGIVLLCIAAFFTISLMLQALDFGVSASAGRNAFYMLGNILFNVYGFSSALIPLFLFIAGLSCFATKWSARKTMRLLTAIVPFFTAVITENICRSILALEHSGFPGVKVFVALVTGLMLIIIEFLGAGIIADKINPILFGNKKTAVRKNPLQREENGTEERLSENDDDEGLKNKSFTQHFGSIGKLNTSGLLFGKKDSESDSKEDENPQGSFEKTGLEEIEEISETEETDEKEISAEKTENIEDEAQTNSEEIKDEVSSVFDKALSQVKNTEEENEDFAEPSASIITEEEYAALTDFGSDQADADEILPEDKRYEEFYRKAMQKAGGFDAEADILGEKYARFFDIEIKADGQKVEPKTAVNVKIELEDAPADEKLVVVHFEETKSDKVPVLMDADTNNAKDIQFEAESFSVYGVIVEPAPAGADDLDGRTFTVSIGNRYMTAVPVTPLAD